MKCYKLLVNTIANTNAAVVSPTAIVPHATCTYTRPSILPRQLKKKKVFVDLYIVLCNQYTRCVIIHTKRV